MYNVPVKHNNVYYVIVIVYGNMFRSLQGHFQGLLRYRSSN